jgi:hypothetical protein
MNTSNIKMNWLAFKGNIIRFVQRMTDNKCKTRREWIDKLKLVAKEELNLSINDYILVIIFFVQFGNNLYGKKY